PSTKARAKAQKRNTEATRSNDKELRIEYLRLNRKFESSDLAQLPITRTGIQAPGSTAAETYRNGRSKLKARIYIVLGQG
ncbi:MAG: hypothetical protein WA153_16465, partial [Candidatus Acidiferrales bacterium]